METQEIEPQNHQNDPDPESGKPEPKIPQNNMSSLLTIEDDSKEQRSLKHRKVPSYAPEMMFLTINLFFIKFYDSTFFELMTFFKITIPIMGYLICTLFLNLLEFMKLLHIEEIEASKNRKKNKNKELEDEN